MDVDRDRIIFVGLAALYPAAEQSRAAPVEPSLLLRATLTALHGYSDGNRAPYEAFWLLCQDNASFAFSEDQGAYSRGTSTTTAWNGIALGLGIRTDIEFMAVIYRAAHRRTPPPRSDAVEREGNARPPNLR